jgi:hypothetical protein
MLYLSFVSPAKIIIPVKENALVYRRSTDNHVVVKTESREYIVGVDLTVSRALKGSRPGHLVIFMEGGKYYIRDLGSRNGTRVNGSPIKGWSEGKPSYAIPVEDGQRVIVGRQTYFIVGMEHKELPAGTRLERLAKLRDILIVLLRARNYLKEKNAEGLLRELDVLLNNKILFGELEAVYRDSRSVIENLQAFYDAISSDKTLLHDPNTMRDLDRSISSVSRRVESILHSY